MFVLLKKSCFKSCINYEKDLFAILASEQR